MREKLTFKELLIGSLGMVGLYLFYGINLLLVLMPTLMLGVPWWAVGLVALAQLVLPFPNLQQAILFILSFKNAITLPFGFLTVLYFISLAIFAYQVLMFFFRPLR